MSVSPETFEERYHAGDVLGSKYRLVERIGEGGMGSVWLARNVVLEVDVAVKLLRLDSASQEAADRLLQEARAAARLGHPSIVRVFDFGQTNWLDPFIVMELLRGESLAALLEKSGKLSPVQAVQTLLPIASALVEAHGKGIVHRDLKPENVILVRDGAGTVPKVVDFGIAKLTGTEVNGSMTQVGQVIGSPSYLSPQQARGVPVDERADVWSMAVMLYLMVAGKLPFAGRTYEGLLASILMDEPPPLQGGDAALEAIIKKGLAKEPDERWPTMRAFGQALAGWAVERGVAVDVTGASIATHWLEPSSASLGRAPGAAAKRRPLIAGVAAVIGLAVVAVAAIKLGGGSSSEAAPATAKPTASAEALGASEAPATAAPQPSTAPAPPPIETTAAATATATTRVSTKPPRKPSDAPKKPGGELPVPANPNF
jgi:serine/threonine-protein kinase